MSTKNTNPDWLNQFKKESEEFSNTEWAKLTDAEIQKIITAQQNGSLSTKRLDSNYQREMSLRSHESKIESGYYESETHKQACTNGGYATAEKHPDLMKDNIQKWREENPEEYARQQAENAEHGRAAFARGRETQKKIKAAQTEAYKQRLYDVVQETEITPQQAFVKYKDQFPEWNDSGCVQMFKRYMRGDLTRWEPTGQTINRSKVYRKIVK